MIAPIVNGYGETLELSRCDYGAHCWRPASHVVGMVRPENCGDLTLERRPVCDVHLEDACRGYLDAGRWVSVYPTA